MEFEESKKRVGNFIVVCSAKFVWMWVLTIGEHMQPCVDCVGKAKVAYGGWIKFEGT
jgi:hypothetical protein